MSPLCSNSSSVSDKILATCIQSGLFNPWDIRFIYLNLCCQLLCTNIVTLSFKSFCNILKCQTVCQQGTKPCRCKRILAQEVSKDKWLELQLAPYHLLTTIDGLI